MEADTDDSDIGNVSTPIVTEYKSKPIKMSPLGQDGTPLLDVIENDLLKQQYTLRTFDSGFSEWTDSASVTSLTDTPRLRGLSPTIYSTPSSSEVDPLSHVSPSEFQRNHRRSWPLKSRKLSFVSSDALSSPESTFLQLKLEEDKNFSHSHSATNVFTDDDSIFTTGSAEGKGSLLCKVLHRSRSCSRSPLSSSSDDLEDSFQEMSLEESSCDSAPQSPISFISSSPVFTFRRLHKSQRVAVKSGISWKDPFVVENDIPSAPLEGNTLESQQSSHTFTVRPNESSCVTSEGRETSSVGELDDRVNIYSTIPADTATSHYPSTSYHTSSDKVNFSLKNHASKASPMQNTLQHLHHSDSHKSNLVCDIDYLSLLPSDCLIKSPSKRSCNISQDICSDSVSPSKVRKLQGGSTSLVLDIDASKRDLFGSRTDHTSDVLNLLPTKEERSNLSSSFIHSSDDRMPQFLNINRCLDLSQESELNPDHCSITTGRLKDCKNVCEKEKCEVDDASLVQRVCHKFSPPCPSQLIGRHIGVKTFDIIGGLKRHNLIGCVEMIFAYIPDCDLLKIVEVSEVWKSAVNEEAKALRRCKILLRRQNSPRKSRNQEGKENMMDKELKENVLMTSSSGLLASIQPQTIRPDNPHSVSLPQHSDFQCGDLLRNCPHCLGRAIVRPAQDRAVCLSEKCAYDFCTKCFFHVPSFHSMQTSFPFCIQDNACRDQEK